MTENKTLYRLPKSGKIFGVCAGLAEYFGMDVVLMRVIFVVLGFITGGVMVLAYIVLAIVMPSSEHTGKKEEAFSEKMEILGQDLRDNRGINRVRNYFGISLLFLGVWLLLGQFFPEWASFRWEIVWPVVLILTGVLIITKGKK